MAWFHLSLRQLSGGVWLACVGPSASHQNAVVSAGGAFLISNYKNVLVDISFRFGPYERATGYDDGFTQLVCVCGYNVAESRMGVYDNSQHTAVSLTRVGFSMRRTGSTPSFSLCTLRFLFFIFFLTCTRAEECLRARAWRRKEFPKSYYDFNG